MSNTNDKELLDLINQLSEKTSALLQHLKSRDIEKSLIAELEEDLKKLQKRIKDKMDGG